MVITEKRTPKEISFYDACLLSHIDGADISDKDWDWGIYFGIPDGAKSIDDCEDSYDKFCFILSLNLKCEGIVPDWYTPCDVCGFIEAHRKVFDRFIEEANREGYRPSDFDEPLIASEDKGYYEVYMGTMENLIAGNYAESDYEKLVRYLCEE